MVGEKLVLEQAGVFPAKILGHCDQLGKSILAKSTVKLYPRVLFTIVQPTANSVVKV